VQPPTLLKCLAGRTLPSGSAVSAPRSLLKARWPRHRDAKSPPASSYESTSTSAAWWSHASASVSWGATAAGSRSKVYS
jgi:hypothetical protein